MDKILKLAIEDAEVEIGSSRHGRILRPVEFTHLQPFTDTSRTESIGVFINKECKHERDRAHYQLAHEAIHTLSPVKYEEVSWLEEGVAVKFSHDFLLRKCSIDWPNSGEKKYDVADNRVRRLLRYDPDAVKKIMSRFGRLSGISAEEMKELFPRVPTRLINALCRPFNI
ncbi:MULTISPECIES: hypothetical protein [Vibrio]|uniref:hypothetical protein n=1 Tax=Vibrio parahaemolyticus TaxID=670 RepID=UPI0009EFDB62|nr:hypothetical protein [Vibrio parahaemolyticus]EGQ8685614.1 hypothetical protein [Vibrio parahaemolyticus]EGQ8782923.1 hypothetical protein [Vibrio parahaemolyticus]EGQ8831949.1 hypothetical protein [Vibrio parahaemolyticus]EGQ8871268.1 hypothetical protein [Vibrio parahaemolyticus]EGQ8879856.1 hypothetical protein [Vibrio parahaemolyticus]